ncbi:RidA family protein [Bradyrhizobium sp. 197]|uniref:RidA family protein n=1 Tax=unclassified Bradyrhizobium TaxID=2631580 RepID=UPI0005843B93|nr:MULTISPECIES: RidA family protein [unclassified Bradyrhizobium]MCK1479645.1 RidA family protein [Bradyrhizobium sp. 197]MCK1518837.1 RidA family protein [Bradyrhizobium sp. 17]
MEIVKLRSGSILEERLAYSRIVAVDNWIFMSLTAGRDYKTRRMPDTALEQAKLAMKNVEGALEAVGSGLSDIVRRRIIVPRQEDVAEVMSYIGEKFRNINPASTVSCGPLGGPEYLFEIEVTAYRGAGSLPTRNLTIAL